MHIESYKYFVLFSHQTLELNKNYPQEKILYSSTSSKKSTAEKSNYFLCVSNMSCKRVQNSTTGAPHGNVAKAAPQRAQPSF